MRKFNEIFLESIPSTNTYAKDNINQLALPALIIANEQTAGRGRRGNSFFSPKDTGLYMTVVFSAPDDCTLLTPSAAVATCGALKNLGVDAKIKWVNDIFVGGRKVCGILAERFLNNGKAYIALGIGINITTEVFPNELTVAGSINISCNKTELANSIAQTILDYSELPCNSLIVEEYKRNLFIIGKDIAYVKNNVEYTAKAVDINEQCNLIVINADGTQNILSSGEISIKI